MNDFTGKILEVDLTDKKIKEKNLDKELYKDFLGGLGLGARYVYNNQVENVDPLDPRNTLGFVPGLLNGINLPLSGRLSVVGKSPLTGTFGDANVGGFFGSELKKAGFDGVFIRGKAEEPVYLNIRENESEIHEADELWRGSTKETIETIRKERGKNTRVASIGPSGEQESLISSIIFDGYRAAARSGLGAVMGSKNLKAISVKGNKEVNIANENKLKEIREEMVDGLSKKPSRVTGIIRKLIQPILPWLLRRGVTGYFDEGTLLDMFKEYGTSMTTSISTEMGDAPCKNWKGVGSRDFPYKEASKISDENVTKYQDRDYACATCVVGCGGIVSVGEPPFEVEEVKKPEYETLAAFGSMTLNNDVESIIKCNEICDLYGLDTISTGSVVAFAIECFEKGILSKEDAGGIELNWGNKEAIVELTKMIAKRKGLGDLLADGVKEATKEIDDGANECAMHIRGQEIPMHDPRLNPSFGNAYVTDPTPARHTKGGAGFNEMGATPNPFKEIELLEINRNEYEGKGNAHAISVKIQLLLDSLGICLFLGYFGKFPLLEAINAVTGWKRSKESLLETGERIQAIRQSFNIREGIHSYDFSLPKRVKGNPPLDAGLTEGITIDLDTMRKDFYQSMSWKEDGTPSEDKLIELGLRDVAEEL
ncbi:aldehyde ferredoxin oxidoreductase [archaeon SCG-AAA382B04]|nr:aldehyde ferredoxin oxidoreductase [archaeon SCG-AAA382B04]